MQDIKRIAKFLVDKGAATFIASVDSVGFPNLKAMLPPRKVIGLKTFYFTTNTSSLRVSQYRENPKAEIYFCDQRNFVSLMLREHIEVLEDAKSKEMIWLETDTQYYKGRSYRSGLLRAQIYRQIGKVVEESAIIRV